MASSKKAPKAGSEEDGITIIGNGKFSLVPQDAINIVERPMEGEENSKLFYNPRGLGNFDPESMEKLIESIRVDGLQQPPLVRATTEGDKVVLVELIAGERRLRSCRQIFDQDLPCFDEDGERPKQYNEGDLVVAFGRFAKVIEHNKSIVTVEFDDRIGKERRDVKYEDTNPTTSGRNVFSFIPCKVVYQCSDQKALRLAFTENEQSEPLSIADEVALVERLSKRTKPGGGLLTQEEIAELLGTNVTWVSQTGNFRKQLPEEAFEKLVGGYMARNVAVSILSYAAKDRQRLFEKTVLAAENEAREKIDSLRDKKEILEDEEDLHLSEARKAETTGDSKAADKAKRKAKAAAVNAAKAAERLQRAEAEKGVIKQGHIRKGAQEAGVSPKKTKGLEKDDIESLYIAGMAEYATGDGLDPLTGNPIPMDLAGMVRRTAMAIIAGERDPLQPIRDYMLSNGLWEEREATTEEATGEHYEDWDGDPVVSGELDES